MNGDISLSETLGGLRIANPDDSSPTFSPSPALEPAHSESSALASASQQQPPLSSHSSSSTVTDKQLQSRSYPFSVSESSSVANHPPVDPNGSLSSSLGPIDQPVPGQQYHDPRLSHRQSMPLSYQAQQQLHYPGQASASASQARGYAPATRPMSAMYNHSNLSAGSQATSYAAYRYGDDPPQPSIPTAQMIQRSGSRTAASSLQPPGLTSRDSNRGGSVMPSPRPYGNHGPTPPRRSSRRVGPSRQSPLPPDSSPYNVEGGPLASSEEWKERGAAVGIRHEVGTDGRTVQKVMKKGVKDFNFGRTLGEGSYSTVLSATDRQTLREYAIKVLDKRHIIKEKKVKYVNIEKDTLNRLTDHPGIVRLYYTFQDERSLYFVLDLASNGELLGVLKKMGTFDEECARFYGAQILDSVDYMHSKGVIHRDLKPENVLLDSHMHVKITDFGTAKILGKPQGNGSGSSAGNPLDGEDLDRAMSFVGTAEYVSPELLTEKNACKASDLWAFGCIIYQLLAGRPPFKASNEYLTFQKIVGLDYTFPDGFPAVARDLVERLLVLDPAKRLPMEHIKNHKFFEHQTWGKSLWKTKAPRLKPFVPPAREPISLNAGPSTLVLTPSGQPRPHPRIITALPPPSQLDIDWSPVLTRNNERILKLGNLNVTIASQPHSPNNRNGENSVESSGRFSRLFGGNTAKRRTRLVMVTSSARIVLAASGGDEKKTKFEVSLVASGTTWKTLKDGRGITSWCVDTPNKHILFEDPKVLPSDPDGSMYAAQEWVEAIERAKDFVISQSLSNSYSGDSALNDLSSQLSSPTSTVGLDADFDGVNIPTARLRKGEHGDTESIKGRKRFSKRHSKNGLAAVF